MSLYIFKQLGECGPLSDAGSGTRRIARGCLAYTDRSRCCAFSLSGLLVCWWRLVCCKFGVAQGAGATSFLDYFYTSGVRIFTLSAEEAANSPPLSKALVIIEAGTGLGFITMVITYLPVLYQLFSRRETHVILLDERAGAPISAFSLICNHARRNALDRLNTLLAAWEQWSAELLESHVSYPMLSYYRCSVAPPIFRSSRLAC